MPAATAWRYLNKKLLAPGKGTAVGLRKNPGWQAGARPERDQNFRGAPEYFVVITVFRLISDLNRQGSHLLQNPPESTEVG